MDYLLETCPICYEDLNDNTIIIKHDNCKYTLHTICYDLYDKCIYCQSATKSNNKLQINFINEMMTYVEKLADGFLFIFSNKPNIFTFVIFVLFCLVIAFIPILFFIWILERYNIIIKFNHLKNKTKKMYLSIYLIQYWIIFFSIFKYIYD